MIGRLIRTLGVWYQYYPHRALMRRLGPRWAIRLSRITALGHWALTWLGMERRTVRAIRAGLGETRRARLGAILWRHLRLKHQHFVEWYTYPTPAGRQFVRDTYAHIEGRRHLDAALTRGRGVVLVMYHFGVGKMIFPALDALGYVTHHHVFRGKTYEGLVYGSLARRAMQEMAETEQRSGLKIIYHRPGYTFPIMVRLLRKNSIVGMNADGMTGTEFADAPFLGGIMAFPTGAARLAAAGGAPLVPVFGLHEKGFRHRLIVHEPIEVGGNSFDDAAAATRACAAVLEQYVRQYPWAWWTWRRVDLERAPDGTRRFVARVLRQDTEDYYHESATPAAGSGAAERVVQTP